MPLLSLAAARSGWRAGGGLGHARPDRPERQGAGGASPVRPGRRIGAPMSRPVPRAGTWASMSGIKLCLRSISPDDRSQASIEACARSRPMMVRDMPLMGLRIPEGDGRSSATVSCRHRTGITTDRGTGRNDALVRLGSRPAYRAVHPDVIRSRDISARWSSRTGPESLSAQTVSDPGARGRNDRLPLWSHCPRTFLAPSSSKAGLRHP